MAIGPSPEEAALIEREQEVRAYRRMTIWGASGAAILLLLGGFAVGRWQRTEIPTLRDDWRPPAPVTVYCSPPPASTP